MNEPTPIPDAEEVLLVTVSGRDRPGLTTQLTGVLADYGVRILDMGQAVIHDSLTLGMLIHVPQGGGDFPMFKRLLFKANELGLQIRFAPITLERYEEWVAEQGRPHHVLTLLGREITAEHLHRVTGALARHGLSIDHIRRLSGRASLRPEAALPRAVIELQVRGEVADLEAMRRDVLDLARGLTIDVAIQRDSIYRRNRRLVAFDMDSTLIQAEVIVELAKAAGVGEQVAAITESAMNGELDFNESFRRRLALLEGLEVAALERIAEALPITEGAERLTRALRQLGYKTAILSGGFDFFARFLQGKLGIDHVHANHLEIRGGRLTGVAVEPIVDGQRKADLLRTIADVEQIQLEQVIAVGDGANDLPMLSVAGLGIAFHAKPVVTEAAEHSIATLGLDAILYLLGMRDRDLA